MIGAAQRALQVTKRGVHPVELRFLHGSSSASADNGVVYAARIGDGAKTSQAVGDHGTALTQVLLAPAGDFGFSKPLKHRQLDAGRESLFGGLHGRHEGGFALGASPGLAAGTLTAQVGVIQLDEARELVLLVPFQHDLHELVLHPPGGVVGDTQMAAQLHGRYAFLVLGNQVDTQKPGRQGELGGFEDSTSRHGGLPVAAVTLLELSVSNPAALVVAAMGTFEAIRPAPGEQCVETLLFSAVIFNEITQTDAFLKLDLVARHG